MYYLRNNFPIKTNSPINSDVPISELDYKKICKERNDQIEADRIKLENQMKAKQAREKLIQERINQIVRQKAEQQLIDEGIIEEE